MRKILALPIFAVLVFVLSFSIPDAHATTTTITDQNSCQSIGGSWASDGPDFDCTVTNLTINSGDKITIPVESGQGGNELTYVKLVNSGTLTINSGGELSLLGALNVNSGSVVDNYGTLDTTGTTGVLLTSIGSTINNFGNLVTAGFNVINGGTIDNSGSFTNAASFSNPGIINEECGSSITLNVSIQSNQPVSDCDATATTISPKPAQVTPGIPITLGATVVDSTHQANVPAGTVSWSSNGGSFNPASCTLSNGACTVSYTASNTIGLSTIKASYLGTLTDRSSSDSFTTQFSAELKDQGSCQSIGGSWNGGTNTCTITNLTVNSGGTLQIDNGITLANSGTITINSGGTIYNLGTVSNTGTIQGSGLFKSSINGISNSGTISDPVAITDPSLNTLSPNFPVLIISGQTTAINSGTTFTINAGNVLTINSGGTLQIDGGATLANSGTITINSGGTLSNLGTVSNSDTIQGSGLFQSSIFGISNSGTISIPVTMTDSSLNTSISINFPIVVSSGNTFTINSGATLTIGAGNALTVNSGGTLTINSGGNISNAGAFSDLGTVNNHGTFFNGGTLDVSGQSVSIGNTPPPGGSFSNSGNISNTGGINIEGPINQCFSSFCFTIANGGTLSNSGSINNCGGTTSGTISGTQPTNKCLPVVTISPKQASTFPGNTLTFTATVTDTSTSPTTPGGTVTWNNGAAGGTFSNSGSCTLSGLESSSSCNIQYTVPSTVGSITITGSYGGDSAHSASSGTSSLSLPTTITISDQNSCESLGGSWTAGSNTQASTCTITSNITIGSGDTLNIDSNIDFQINPGVTLDNSGTINNSNSNSFINDLGTIVNDGTINDNFVLIVHGQLTNSGTVNINGNELEVYGTLDNKGTIAFTSGSDLFNTGTLFNECSSKISGIYNLLSGSNQPVNQVCDTIPPTTTATFSGTTGTNGWYTSSVSVTLSATDNHGGSGVKTTSYSLDGVPQATYSGPFTVTGDSNHTLTFNSTDNAGNAELPNTLYIAIDTTPPVITVPPDVTQEATGPQTMVTLGTATANDSVDGPVTVTNNVTASYPVGVTKIQYSATDLAGNTATAYQTVTITDTTQPAITVPTQVTAQATGPSGAVVTYVASATDLVDGTVTPVCIPPSGSTFAFGTTAVTCTATDAHNNKATGTFDVIVQNNVPPTLSISSPANNAIVNTATIPVSGTASDIVSVSSVSWKVDTGAVSTVPGITPGPNVNWSFTTNTMSLGTHTIQVNATDSAGLVTISQITITYAAPTGSIPPPSGSGQITFSSNTGGFTNLDSIPQSSLPISPPSGSYPLGFFSWGITGFAPATSVTVTVTSPTTLGPQSQYFKLIGGTWVAIPVTVHGNEMTFTISDNGPFDGNPTVGVISDPGAVANPTDGRVTGGGNIGKGTNFAFDAVSDIDKANSIKGNFEYQDKYVKLDLHSNNVSFLSVDSTASHATIVGVTDYDRHGKHESHGANYTFLATVSDPDKTGAHDMFSITVTNSTGNVVYQNSGTVKGHIEIHKFANHDDKSDSGIQNGNNGNQNNNGKDTNSNDKGHNKSH